MKNFAIHPGSYLAEELTELGISAAQAAREIGVPANRLSQILNGKRAMTADTALRLAHWLGTSAQMWMGLQSAYDLAKAERDMAETLKSLPRRVA
jgi:addiction module HigA family antidote